MILNDVHSALNPTAVAHVETPLTFAQLCSAVRRAHSDDQQISVAGGKHAMGGQQFLAGGLHIDCTKLDRVIEANCTLGLITVEAGMMWPALIAATHTMLHPDGGTWAIRQKQTGVDDVTLAGSVSVAAHGRGLLMQPLSDDIESVVVVDATGTPIFCSRNKNVQLFSLVVGGYGLFGIIYSVQIRLSQRRKLIRVVDVIELDDAANAIYRRVADGCIYGDFQYAIDDSNRPRNPQSACDPFLRKGVFACYKPAPENSPEPNDASDLSEDAWLKLLALAHTDKTRAFKVYAGHYLQTDGNIYWSDSMQLSTYIPSYAEYLQQHSWAVQSGDERHDQDESGQSLPAKPKESLIIGEHYVPAAALLEFMQSARKILRQHDSEVIYGTLRAIQADTTSFLAWAKQDYVCIIFNLRTAHTAAGISRTANTFRALIDASQALGGCYFLPYHRFATPEQLERSHPKIREFFALKRQYDPSGRFQSDWYQHYAAFFAYA